MPWEGIIEENMEQASKISFTRNHEELGMEQVWSDLEALKKLYGLLHKGHAEVSATTSGNAQETLDEKSRALLMRMLDDATQQALLKQAKILSGPLMSPALEKKLSFRSDGGICEPWVESKVSPKPYLSGDRDGGIRGRLKLQNSMRSRDGHHHRPIHQCLDRVGSNRSSSRTAMVHHMRTSPLDRHPQREDALRHTSTRLQSSERNRHLSSEPAHKRTRLEVLGRTVSRRHTNRPFDSMQSPRHVRRLDAGLSIKTDLPDQMARCNQVRKKRVDSSLSLGASSHGLTRPNKSSSNLTIASHNRNRSNQELSRRCLHRVEGRSGLRKDATTDRVAPGRLNLSRRTLSRIKSSSSCCSSSSSSTRSGSASTSRTMSSTCASCSSASCSDPRPAPRHNVRRTYPCRATSTSTSRARRRHQLQDNTRIVNHHREMGTSRRSRETGKMKWRKKPEKKKREGRLRRLKNKVAVVFHHHHHHFGHADGNNSSSRESSVLHHEHYHMLPWKCLGRIFHRTSDTDQEKKINARQAAAHGSERAALSVAAKSDHGHLHALFDALLRHLWGTRRKPAARAVDRAGLRRMASRVQVEKLHWWQRLRRRRGGVKVAGSKKPRLRSGPTAKAQAGH